MDSKREECEGESGEAYNTNKESKSDVIKDKSDKREFDNDTNEEINTNNNNSNEIDHFYNEETNQTTKIEKHVDIMNTKITEASILSTAEENKDNNLINFDFNDSNDVNSTSKKPFVKKPESKIKSKKVNEKSSSSSDKPTVSTSSKNKTSHPTSPSKKSPAKNASNQNTSTPIRAPKNLTPISTTSPNPTDQQSTLPTKSFSIPTTSTPQKPAEADHMLTSRLREVFDVCDNQSQGFITVEHFLGLAKDFASSDTQSNDKFMKRMVAALDSDSSGKISFEDFCKGVKQILLSNKSVLENGEIDPKVIQDFITIRRQSVDSSKSPEIYETPPSPSQLKKNNANKKNPFDLFSNEKAASNSSEDDVDSGAWSTVTQDNFWLNSTPSSGKNFYIEATPSPLSNAFPGKDFADNVAFTSANDTAEVDDRSINFFHRRVHSNNTTPRSSFRSTPGSRHGSFRKTVTANSIANQSFRSGSTVNCSDLLLDAADSHVSELTDKILKLEDNVTSLTEIQQQNEDKQLKMKEENAMMVERVHVLEDQLRDIESMNQERLKEEENKYREIMVKTEKDKSNQIELLSRSLKLVESEYNSLKEATPAMKAENERLKKQNFNLEREMARMRQEYTELNDEKYSLQQSFTVETTRMNKEREARTQLLDDLTQELNELRICKSNLLRASPNFMKSNISNEQSEQDIQHIQDKIKIVKKENSSLKVELEEMQDLLLSRGVMEGQRLLQQTSTYTKSLASEIDEIPKNELITALKLEQDANSQLKEYIGFITLRILEKNPSLLEINKLPDDYVNAKK